MPAEQPRRVAVIVPARDERDVIRATLDALARSVGDTHPGIGLDVIVVCGASSDSTAGIAREWMDAATAGDAGLAGSVVELVTPGKAAALNAADAALAELTPEGHDLTVYLDADVALETGAITAMLAAVDSGAHLVGCRLAVARPRSWISRAYATTWLALPSVSADSAGAGCFAVSRAGRARWSEFPADLPDDAWVRSLFAPAECATAATTVTVRFPEADRLVGVVARWRSGNRDLRERDQWGERQGRGRNLAAVIRSPAAAANLAVFVLVNLAARLHGRTEWARAR
jgi:hypothetical protein